MYLGVDVRGRRKILKPRERKPLKAIRIRRLSPTSYVLKSSSVTARETRSAATARETGSTMAYRRVLSPSSSSNGVEVVKEVPAPAGVSSNKPWTRLSKQQFVSSDEE